MSVRRGAFVYAAEYGTAGGSAARAGDPSSPIANECSRGQQARVRSSSSMPSRANFAAHAATSDESSPPESKTPIGDVGHQLAVCHIFEERAQFGGTGHRSRDSVVAAPLSSPAGGSKHARIERSGRGLSGWRAARVSAARADRSAADRIGTQCASFPGRGIGDCHGSCTAGQRQGGLNRGPIRSPRRAPHARPHMRGRAPTGPGRPNVDYWSVPGGSWCWRGIRPGPTRCQRSRPVRR